MADEDQSPEVSPFSQSTPIGRQRVAEAERSMRAHAHPWDGKAIAGVVVFAAVRELILETHAGSLVVFDTLKQLRGVPLAVGMLVNIAENGTCTLDRNPERHRGLSR